MLRTTAGQLLVNQALPEDLRDYNRVLDRPGLTKLMRDVAEKHPDKYRDVLHELLQVGHRASFASGSTSVSIKHLRTPDSVKKRRLEIQAKVDKIYSDPRLSDDQKERKVVDLLMLENEPLQQLVYDEATKTGNPLGTQVKSGARGNKANLRTLLGGDLVYVDHHDRPIPMPVLRSYAEGLTPAEYFAGAFGARKGVIDTKLAVQNAGAYGKQLIQSAHRLLVTADDSDAEDQVEDSTRGLPSSIDDPDNVGALLAAPAGKYPRNTILTAKIVADLRAKGVQDILVRSPLVGGPPDGGVYARDLGIREKGRLPPRGDYVGIAAAQALSEPMSQAQMCLAAGTLVLMADLSYKKIEDIRVGDMVWGVDYYPDRGMTRRPVRVLRTFDNGPRDCVRVTYRTGADGGRGHPRTYELIATADHKVLTDSGEHDSGVKPREAGCTHIYTPMACVFLFKNDHAGRDWTSIARREDVEEVGPRPTYDIEVDHPDHLFVLANGLVVSNSSKHSGGVAGAAKGVSGFALVNQLTQVPEVFKGGAAHAKADGTVTEIAKAPQGGHFVTIAGEKHYVGSGYGLKVKKGDTVEAGDVISEGIPNPAEIVHHKGIGEGRRYFTQAYRDAYKDAGIAAHRRNIELVARGLINHVRVNQELDGYVPDDVVNYHWLEHNYQPRPGHTILSPGRAANMYLERPALHYSIGTKLRPSVIAQLDKYKVKNIVAHAEPPPFEPEMIRGMANLSHDPDWMTQFLGAYTKKNLLSSAHRGAVSDAAGTSYVPALAESRDFGRLGKTVGYLPSSVLPGSGQPKDR